MELSKLQINKIYKTKGGHTLVWHGFVCESDFEFHGDYYNNVCGSEKDFARYCENVEIFETDMVVA